MLIRASLVVLLIMGSVARAESLPDCPDSPNCVSSLATDPDRRVEPLPGGENAETARAHLEALLEGLPRVRYEIGPEGRRVEAVFRTRLFRFKDDVDFYIRDEGVIEVRSASRLGWWDFGANRRRVERLREQLRQSTGRSEPTPDD